MWLAKLLGKPIVIVATKYKDYKKAAFKLEDGKWYVTLDTIYLEVNNQSDYVKSGAIGKFIPYANCEKNGIYLI